MMQSQSDLPEGIQAGSNQPESEPQPINAGPDGQQPTNGQPVIETSPRDKRLWGPWATAGLGVVAFGIDTIGQVVVMVIFGIISAFNQYSSNSALDPQQLSESLSTNGLMLSIAVIVSSIMGTGFIILVIAQRKGISIGEYLGLRRINIKTIGAIIGIIFVLFGISIIFGLIFKVPEGSNPIVDAYKNTQWPALFWISTVIFAPIFEETLFRGFLFVGLKQSIIGPVGTIILTALVFTSLHALQYKDSGIAVTLSVIFILGLTLGLVRWRTNSLWATILLHGCWNLVQMVILELSLRGIG